MRLTLAIFFSGERDRGVLLGDDPKVAVFGNVDEDALELAHAVFKRANELFTRTGASRKSLKVLRAGELAVDAGRGDLWYILRNGVFAVQHGLMARVRSAVVDAYAAFALSKMRADTNPRPFRERNVPDYEPKLFASGSASARTISVVLPFFFSLPYAASFLRPLFGGCVCFGYTPKHKQKKRVAPTLSSSYYLTVKIIPQRRFFCKGRKTKFSAQNTGVFYVFWHGIFTGCLPLPRKTTSVRFISRKTQKRTRRLFAVTSVVCAYFIPLRIQARRSCSLPHRPLRAYSAR